MIEENNKNKYVKPVSFLVILLFLVFCIFPSNWMMNLLPFYRKKMIQDTILWCRIAVFPEQATEFDISVGGNAFTREYKGRFIASKEVIEQWILNSNGLQEAEPEAISDGVFEYNIKPGDGAQFAEVVVDFNTGTVTFKTYWS